MRVSLPSNYLKADDLQGRRPEVTIERLALESFEGEGEKYILYFAGKDKGLVLNVTNTRTLIDALGDESDDWIGATVELFTIDVDFQGRLTKGLRLRVVSAPQRERRPAPPVQDGPHHPVADDEIPF